MHSYRQYTNVSLATYSDVTGTQINANPVELSNYGITPNVFLDGNYGSRLTDKYGVQLWSRDHIAVAPEQFDDWSPTLSYRQGDIVTASDGGYYQSLTSNNINNDPLSSPSSWIRIRLFEADDGEIERLELLAATAPGVQDILAGNGDSWSVRLLSGVARNYLTGLQIASTIGGSLDVQVGAAASADNQRMLYLQESLTKVPLAPFVPGNGNGAMATGASLPVNNFYCVFLVRIGSVTDVLLDSSPICANGVANNGVSHYRRIGYLPTESGGAPILGVIQQGDYFFLTAPRSAFGNIQNPGTAATLRHAAFVPPHCAGIMSIALASLTNNPVELLVSDVGAPDTAPSDGNYTIRTLPNVGAAYIFSHQTMIEYVDGESRLRTRLSYSDADVSINAGTFGWIDTRDR